MPTLLVHGDRDVRAPLPVARHLAASIPGSTLVVLPDAGHVCNIEAPAAFNQAVRTFLHLAGLRGPVCEMACRPCQHPVPSTP